MGSSGACVWSGEIPSVGLAASHRCRTDRTGDGGDVPVVACANADLSGVRWPQAQCFARATLRRFGDLGTMARRRERRGVRCRPLAAVMSGSGAILLDTNVVLHIVRDSEVARRIDAAIQLRA